MKERFKVLELTRDDFYCAGFDASNLDDSQMEKAADFLAECFDQPYDFIYYLSVYAKEHNLARV